MLTGLPLNDRLMSKSDIATSRVASTLRELEKLGWVEGRNLKYEIRSSYGGPEARAVAVKELINLNPDLILTASTIETAAVLEATRTIPVIFATAIDPVGSGFVESLARPGRNATGYTNSDADMGGKWLQFLKEADPRITRVGVLFNPKTAAREGRYFLAPIEAAGASIGVTVAAVPVTDPAQVDAAVGAYAGDPPGGLIVQSDPYMVIQRQAIVDAAARHRVPTIYPFVYFMEAGGLMSYGAALEVRAAEYINLILRGAKPAELPVQSPRKYELLINLKAAEALGLKLPLSLITRADQITP
jgi:putative ABC transport system substrate-binding protein